MDSNAVIVTAGASVGFFKLVNTALKRLPVPESACRNPWKWRNISTSLVHSLITGFWAVLCFCVHPEMAEDLRSTHTVFSHALVSVSIGYFIYDFFDMFLNQKISQAWELLFHHTVVHRVKANSYQIPLWFSRVGVIQRFGLTGSILVLLPLFRYHDNLLATTPRIQHPLLQYSFSTVVVVVCCFGLSALTQQFVGFSVVALLVEINSVFLHLRQALRMAGLSGTMPYRLNRALNLGTYVVFRISTLAWMTRWLVLNRSHIPLPSYTVGSLGLGIMTAMNIVLFCRLLRSDVLKVGSEGKREK